MQLKKGKRFGILLQHEAERIHIVQ